MPSRSCVGHGISGIGVEVNSRYRYIQVMIAISILAVLGVFAYFNTRLIAFSGFLSYLTLAYFLVIALIAYSYREVESDITPVCDVIIPAYNEGRNVYDTVRSVIECDYPPEKLHVIVVDDGSRDDTRKWIERAAADFPRVRGIFKIRNAGKKHALSDAIRSSNAEIIVTIDSDCVIEKNTITNIVKPFVDKKTGAVAGNIRVSNLQDGVIPQMMDTVLAFCYEFIRSSQSRFGTVMCAAGALSAFRREALLPLLDRWLGQRFLGAPTTIGEDRALTTLLLRNDWNVVYQTSAVVYTAMPTSYANMCKMLLRWMRGDIRENIEMFTYVFRKFNPLDMRTSCLQLHYIALVIGICAPVFSLPISVFCLVVHFSECMTIAFYILIISMIWSIIPAMIYARRYSVGKSFYAFVYGIFSLLCLSWIPLYSVLTVGNNKWMTREDPR